MRWILGFCALTIVLILYQSLVAIPKQNQQNIESQQSLERDERQECAIEARNTAVMEYAETYCIYTTTAACSNGTYLIAQYNNAYSECLQTDGLSY